jgi:AraC-like DNA-binding protein
MSRSAFAARFTELVGEPVMSYVAHWRMQVAVAALKEESATIGRLADRLGHRSEAAFSRAFKRVVGVSPGAIRRSAGEQDRALIVAGESVESDLVNAASPAPVGREMHRFGRCSLRWCRRVHE